MRMAVCILCALRRSCTECVSGVRSALPVPLGWRFSRYPFTYYQVLTKIQVVHVDVMPHNRPQALPHGAAARCASRSPRVLGKKFYQLCCLYTAHNSRLSTQCRVKSGWVPSMGT